MPCNLFYAVFARNKRKCLTKVYQYQWKVFVKYWGGDCEIALFFILFLHNSNTLGATLCVIGFLDNQFHHFFTRCTYLYLTSFFVSTDISVRQIIQDY